VVRERVPLYDHFLADRRDIRFFYYRNCAPLDIYSAYRNTDCPNAENVQNQTLMMPTYPKYGDKQIQKNLDSIATYFDKAA